MTAYCYQIKNESERLWTYLSSVFSYGLKQSELGVTFWLIHDLVNFYAKKGHPIDAWINQASNEQIKGADLDLYIQDPKGYFTLFRLQAKMMNHKGRYYDISKWSSNAQYNKLIKHSRKEGAVPLYLLYNGYTINSGSGSPSYGYSITSAEVIKQYRLTQHKKKLTKTPKITFDDIFNKMEPFEVLFCQELLGKSLPRLLSLDPKYQATLFDNDSPKQFTLSEILETIDQKIYRILSSKSVEIVRKLNVIESSEEGVESARFKVVLRNIESDNKEP